MRRIRPCEYCRSLKKKCSLECPCERCLRLGVECVYTNYKAGIDPDYESTLRQVELLKSIDQLEDQLESLERVCLSESMYANTTVAVIPSKRRKSVYVIPTEDSDFSPLSEETDISSSEDENQTHVEWRIIPTQSGYGFITNIHTIEDLMKQLSNIHRLPHIRKPFKIPFASTSDNGYYVRRNTDPWWGVLRRESIDLVTKMKTDSGNGNDNNLISNGNGSGQYGYDSKLSMVPVFCSLQTAKLEKEMETDDDCLMDEGEQNIFRKALADAGSSLMSSLSPVRLIVYHLIRNFFHCHNSRYFPVFHQRYFFKTFYDAGDPLQSPVVIALTALTTALRCKHVFEFLPRTEARKIGIMAFDHARELLRDCFDSEDFSTFAAYSLLAHYEVASMNPIDSYTFFEMAGRLAHILAPRYAREKKELLESSQHNEEKLQEIESFKRLEVYSFAVASENRFVLYVHKVHVPPDLIIHKSIAYDLLGPPAPMPDENLSPQLFKFVELYISLRLLGQKLLFDWIADKPQVPSTMVSQSNQELLDWYRALPKDMQLPNPLFQPIDREEHRKCIKDPKYYPFNLRLAVRLYTVWLALHEQFLPDLPDEIYPRHADGSTIDPRKGLNTVESQAIDICFNASCMILDLFEAIAWADSCHMGWAYNVWSWDFLGWMIRFHGPDRERAMYRLVRSLEISGRMKAQMLEDEAAGGRDPQALMKDWPDLDQVVAKKKAVLEGLNNEELGKMLKKFLFHSYSNLAFIQLK